ncbi:hypothetical protein T11_4084 [Trichinella zimbabwensis]|uniref:Uncharacterized protein n=1 Tax=Trichinella zimbabwensis TaxID=268475 RepID=A0A0V1HQ91_9BILA|nr:hypothetical protein T11_4084 [Trichinella zimbabwensis]KRZ12710.1 hypothetical protein T11_4084 [Trichinella zimbabwensis]
MFENFLAALPQENLNERSLLINFVSPRFYSSIARSSTYEDAIQSLKSIFEKPVNEIYARHLLATRKQLQAGVLDAALRSSENYYESRSLPETVAATANDEDNERLSESPGVVAAARNPRYFFCGRSKHPRFQCLQPSVGSTFPLFLAEAVVEILLCGKEINCSIDSGSSESFIHPEVVERLGLKIIPSSEPVGMALSAFSIKALGCITVDLEVQDRLYKSFRRTGLPHLCADVILGQNFH